MDASAHTGNINHRLSRLATRQNVFEWQEKDAASSFGFR